MKKLFLSLILCCCFYSGAVAEKYSTGLISGLLDNASGARALAMGKAQTASVYGPASLIWNPAALAAPDYSRISLSHMVLFEGAYQSEMGVSKPLTDFFGLNLGFPIGVGVDLIRFSLPDITERDSLNNITGQTADARTAFIAGMGVQLTKKINVGMSGKYLSKSVAGMSASAFDADLGLLYNGQKWAMGAQFQNLINSKLTRDGGKEEVGRIIRLGGSRNLLGNLLLTGDLSFENGGNNWIRTGIEYKPLKWAALRGGFDGVFLTAGAGFYADKIGLDYAILKNADLGLSHRMSFLYAFGNTKEEVEIKRMWRAKGVKEAGLRPPSLSIESVSFTDSIQSNSLSAGDSGIIRFIVKNKTGAGAAVNLTAKVSVSPQIDAEFPETIDIGEVWAGEEAFGEIPIRAGLNLRDGKVDFKINFYEEGGNPPEPMVVPVTTLKLRPPHVGIGKISIDDSMPGKNDGDKLSMGNGNNIIDAGESAEVHVVLVNSGSGSARKVRVRLKSDSGENIKVLESGSIRASYQIGDMPAGSWQKLTFAISVSRLHKDTNLPLSLDISEERNMFHNNIPLGISLGQVLSSEARVYNMGGTTMDFSSKGPLPTFGKELNNVPSYSTRGRKNSYALIIGIERYMDVVGVPYALNDANMVRAYFNKALGIPLGNIKFLENEYATKALISNSVAWLKNQIKAKGTPDSKIFVYFAGHGSPDPVTGKPFILPYDGSPDYINTSGYPLEELYTALASANAGGALVILDSCFSGSKGPRTLLAKGLRPIVIRYNSDIPAGVTILSASSGSQVSGIFEEKNHGLFTYFLLSGLQGKAADPGGKITLNGLFDYLNSNVVKQAIADNREQEPELRPKSGLGIWQTEPLAVK